MLNNTLRTLNEYRDYEGGVLGSALALPIFTGGAFLANHWFNFQIHGHTVGDQLKFLWATKDFERYSNFVSAYPSESVVFFSIPAAAALGYGFFVKYLFRKIDPKIHIRGRRFLTGRAAIKDATKAQKPFVKSTGLGLMLGKVPISRQKQLQSSLVMGAQGGGKTVVINSLLKQSLEDSTNKNVIFDLTKGDFTGWVNCPILSPTDSRSIHWWLGADLVDLGDAATFAESIIPAGDDPFWSSTAQNVLISCVLKLQQERGKNWSWAELSQLVFNSEIEELKEISDSFYLPAKNSLVDAESKMTGSIITTLRSFCSPIFRMGLVTKRIQNKKFSLIQWLTNDESKMRNLIIQGDKKDSNLSSALARAVVNLSTKHISSLQFTESKTRKLNFFLDELPQAGKLADIASLLEIGRSKGISVVLGFQDISQVQQIYGKEEAQKWLALCGIKIFPKVQGSISQKFVSDEIGDRDIEFKTRSMSGGDKGAGNSFSMQRQTVPVLVNSQLESDFGPVKNGIDALVLGIGGNALKLHFPFQNYPKIRKSWVGWALEKDEEAQYKTSFSLPKIQPQIEILPSKSESEIEAEKTELLGEFDSMLGFTEEVSAFSKPPEAEKEAIEAALEPATNEIICAVLGVDAGVVEVANEVFGLVDEQNSAGFSILQTTTQPQQNTPYRRKRREKEGEIS